MLRVEKARLPMFSETQTQNHYSMSSKTTSKKARMGENEKMKAKETRAKSE